MKVESDGMVAIIQGLRDAGLAVTLLGRGNAEANAVPITHTKSSVETRAPRQVDASAQQCDDRYTSSYQVAHCNVKPSSPSPNSPEFPRRRKEGSATQGNFEIGEQANMNGSAPITISFHHSGGHLSPDRGPLSNTQSSKGTVTFVNSLRKYPSVLPEKLSSEFVQQLITYTQAKNFAKSAFYSKARKKYMKERIAETTGKFSKGVQTNERATRKERDSEINNTRNINASRYRPTSPEDWRDMRYKDVRVRETYDYLSARRYRSRESDVRYLSDVTRCLRDTLRQIYDDQSQAVFQVCPTIQDRYSRHRREHHRDCMDRRSSTDSNNMEAQVSVPMVSRGVSCLTSCDAMPGTYMPVCPVQPELCCYCQKPLPCFCLERSEEEMFQKQLEEVVCSWLEELPVAANDRSENKTLREIMVMDLIDKLKSLYRDEYFEANAKNEITQCVNSLPMWCPGGKKDQEAFRVKIIDNLMNKIRGLSSESQKYKKEIANWLDDISFNYKDTQGKIVDVEAAKVGLVEKLGTLALNPPSDDDELKSEVVEILNEFPIKVDKGDDTYIGNLAQTLADKIQTLPSKAGRRESSLLHDAYDKQIGDWLKDVPGFSRRGSSNQKQVEALTAKLQKLQAKGIDNEETREEMQNEINDWLERNADELDPKTKKNLTEKLLKKLEKASKDVVSKRAKTVSPNKILEWLEDIPELSESKSENQKTAQQLANKLQELFKDNKSESDIESEISSWLTKKLKSKGERLDSKTQKKIVKKLLGELNAAPSLKDEEDLTNNILDILEDLPDLDITSDKSKKIAGQLAKKMRELQTSSDGNVNEDDIKDEINDWLSDLSKATGVKLTPREKEKLTNKLLSVATNIPKQRKRWSKQGDLKKVINDQIAEIFDNSALKLDNEIKEELQKKITDLVANNIDKIQSTGSDDIKTDIVDILEEEGGLTNRKAKQIADEIISITKTVMVPRSRTMSQEEEFKKTLQSEVTNILDGTQIEDKDEVESEISNILADQALRGETDEKTRERLINVLKNSNLSDEECEKVATQLMGMERDLSEKSHIQPDVTPTFNSLTPSQKQMFIDNAQNEISDFTESLIRDRSDYSPKKFKFAVAKLAERVGDIMSDSNTTSSDKEELLNDEVMQYFDDLKIPAGPKQKEQAKKLVDKLQNLAFTTSTPRSSNAATGTGFRRKESLDPTMSTIVEDSTYNQYKQPPSTEEKQYMSQLSTKIDSWLTKLPIDFNMKDGMAFKETMIKDLANDIVDRQKYLQLNPNAKTSEAEELEHLKYQVFRWLNKLPDVQQLMPSIAKTNELMTLLKGVSVPKLIKDKGFAQTSSSQQTFDFQQTSNLSSIQDEISNWFEVVPSHLFTSKDKSHHKQMIKELAGNINEYQKNNTLTETALDQLILDWLQKMITGSSQSLKNKSEGLKEFLINKGLVSFPDFSLNNSQVAGIDEWIQSLPLKSRRTSTDMKQMERVKQDFVQSLKEIPLQYPPGTPNYETKMKEAIKKYLQLFPIEPNKRKDQAFLQQKVEELFNKLKFSPAEHQSEMSSVNIAESKQLVHDWISNLPFKPGKSRDDVKKDVDDFVASMKAMFKNKNIDETNVELLDKVKGFLKTLPLQQNLVTDDHAKDLVAKLISSIKSSTKPSVTNAADIFYNNIETWCDSLPIFGGDTPEEIERGKALKQNIISKLLNKIGDLNMKPEIFQDDTLYEDLLKDEIDDLIGPLLQTPELKSKMESFKDNLIDKVRKAKHKAQNEMEAHAYKQQLRDAISTTLPPVDKTAVEEQVPFEILKDNVADAYINLSYTPDKELKNKYKQKIGDEINKFCNDYLKRYPASPVDSKKLNENLYTALQKVPRPKDDTIKSQVEQVRIKDQIHEWLNDIPLEDETPAQQLQKNKIVSVLANELHETEKEKQANPDIDVDDRFRQDIVKWTRKLPLKPEAKDKIDEEVDKLIERLKSTEGVRRFSISYLKRASMLPQYQMPPSSLSKDDRAHLDRIRQRTQRSPGRRPFNICLCKDASVNPIPIDTGSQTEMRVQPLSPNVNVNEYNWNSTTGSNVWDSRNGLQSGSPYPSMVGKSHPRMSQQQMPSPHLPQENESMAWSPSPEQSSSRIQQNQDESLQSLQPVPCSPVPPPCLNQPPSPPPCMPQQTQPCIPQQTQPCMMPLPTCTKPPPSYMTPPPCAAPQPPCTPYPQSYASYSPYVSPPPCERPSPLPCQRPPCSPVGTSTQPCIAPQPPRTPSPPWVTPSYGPQPSSSTLQNPCYPSAPPPCLHSGSGTAQRRKRPQFYMKSSDFSSTSTPAEDYQGQTFRCPPRVTRLGSLDNVPPCKRTFANQTEVKRPCAPPVEECEWGTEEDGYFGVACPRRPFKEFTRVGEDDRPTCHCKKRCLGKPLGGRGRGKLTPCLTSNSMKQCSKCCGVHCPHPSYLFFR